MPKKCWNRVNKAGATYVVCNDPPRGSRGQSGVYQAENPTGKQDGRTKRKEAEIDKQRVRNRLRKDMLKEDYQTMEAGVDGLAIANQETPSNAPATSTMRRQLRGEVADKNLDGMDRRYIYNQWARKAKEGKAFLKKHDYKRPPKFKGMGEDDLKDLAESIADGFKEVDRRKDPFMNLGWAASHGGVRNRGEPMTKKSAEKYEKGELKKEQREIFEGDVLRYKHLLELAGKDVPDWVKDISR